MMIPTLLCYARLSKREVPGVRIAIGNSVVVSTAYVCTVHTVQQYHGIRPVTVQLFTVTCTRHNHLRSLTRGLAGTGRMHPRVPDVGSLMPSLMESESWWLRLEPEWCATHKRSSSHASSNVSLVFVSLPFVRDVRARWVSGEAWLHLAVRLLVFGLGADKQVVRRRLRS